MIQGEKKIVKIEKIILVLIILCVFIAYNVSIYDKMGDKFISIQEVAVSGLTVVLLIVLAVKYGIGFYNGRYLQKSEKAWRDTKEGAKSKIIWYLKNNVNCISMPVVLQLMDIYRDEEEIFCKLLHELVILYSNGNSSTKSILSFFLLLNESNNEVARLFEQNMELKAECEQISKENVIFAVTDFKKLKDGVTEKDLIIIFREFLHSCLPNNSISKEETVHLLEFIVGWILKNVTKNNIDSYQESMLLFALMLPAIKRKIKKSNIHSDTIEQGLFKIENSEWFRYLFCQSYKYVDFCLHRNEAFFIKNNIWITYSCMTSTYYEKMRIDQRMKLLYNVKMKQQQFYKEYNSEKIVWYVLMSSPLRMFKNEEDWIYNALSLVYLCIGNISLFE
jgi:hypothetical protein